MSVERDADRLLAVIYVLAEGRVGVEIPTAVLSAKCRQLNLFEMTDDEFVAWYERELEPIKIGKRS